MILRPERPTDFAEIRVLIEAAFRTARDADGDEPDFVEQLRPSPGYIPELALVAEDNGSIFGHVMLTSTAVATAAGPHPVLLLAVVAVAPPRQGKGLGARLVNAGLRRAREQGHTGVMVVGDPAFYGRFGFVTSLTYGIKNINQIPDQFVMALELASNGLKAARGTIALPT